MDSTVPGVNEAQYRLLGLQAIPHDDGVILRRGTRRIFFRGEAAGELVDLIVARSAEGRGLSLAELRLAVDTPRHETLNRLFQALVAERLLVPAASFDGDDRKETVFYWSRDAGYGASLDNLAKVEIAVFGVNHIALPLIGNLRSCGFRHVTLIDHPALRNLDFFNERHEMRKEIASALGTPPRNFEEWSAASPSPDCHVVCSDFGGLALMRDWNRRCVAENKLFYPVVLQDEVAYLGPLVVPGDGPCFECLWARQNANLGSPELERATESHAFFGQKVAGFLQPMARIAADIGAIDLLKYFSGTLGGGKAGRLIEADLMTPALTTRNVLRVPRCPVCARAPEMTEAPAAEAPVAEGTAAAIETAAPASEAEAPG